MANVRGCRGGECQSRFYSQRHNAYALIYFQTTNVPHSLKLDSSPFVRSSTALRQAVPTCIDIKDWGGNEKGLWRPHHPARHPTLGCHGAREARGNQQAEHATTGAYHRKHVKQAGCNRTFTSKLSAQRSKRSLHGCRKLHATGKS